MVVVFCDCFQANNGVIWEVTMSDFLCVGDLISLFCEETEGYIYNWQSRYVLSYFISSEWGGGYNIRMLLVCLHARSQEEQYFHNLPIWKIILWCDVVDLLCVVFPEFSIFYDSRRFWKYCPSSVTLCWLAPCGGWSLVWSWLGTFLHYVQQHRVSIGMCLISHVHFCDVQVFLRR